MPHKEIALLLLLAGCAAPQVQPRPIAQASEPPRRWWLAERDGIVIMEPERLPIARFDVRLIGPAHPRPGDVAAVEIVVPEAEPGERHRFLVHACHPSVRLLDPEFVTTIGRQSACVRFTSDVAAAGAIRIEPLE